MNRCSGCLEFLSPSLPCRHGPVWPDEISVVLQADTVRAAFGLIQPDKIAVHVVGRVLIVSAGALNSVLIASSHSWASCRFARMRSSRERIPPRHRLPTSCQKSYSEISSQKASRNRCTAGSDQNVQAGATPVPTSRFNLDCDPDVDEAEDEDTAARCGDENLPLAHSRSSRCNVGCPGSI